MGFIHLTKKGPVDPEKEIEAIDRREAAAALRRYIVRISPAEEDRYCLFAIIDTLYKRGVDVQDVLIKHLNAEYQAAETEVQDRASSVEALGDSSESGFHTTHTQPSTPPADLSHYSPAYDENGFYCG